jgi:hypothetical protein
MQILKIAKAHEKLIIVRQILFILDICHFLFASASIMIIFDQLYN